MNDKLEILLKTKSEIETPQGLEERIMRRINSESAKKKGLTDIFFSKYAYGFASLAALLIAVSVVWNQQSIKIAKEAKELSKLEQEIKLYESASKLMKQVESEEKIEKDLQKIQELDEYIEMLSS